MSMQHFQGTGVAIITPFKQDGSIDFPALERLLEHLIVNGVDFIVALGTTSEAVTLTASERAEVVGFVKQTVAGRVPVVMGMGGNNTAAVLESMASTDFDGISGILSVAPYYNKPNQRGLLEHFGKIAEASPVPVILYNVPGRTSSNIAAATVLQLARTYENIVAVKEASGDLGQIMDILKEKPDGFEVLSGDDALTYPMMALGAKGVISVTANALPKPFSNMVRAALDGRFDEATQLHYAMLDFTNALFADGNPAGIKAALSLLGICENVLRLPMVPVNDVVYGKLENLIGKESSLF